MNLIELVTQRLRAFGEPANSSPQAQLALLEEYRQLVAQTPYGESEITAALENVYDRLDPSGGQFVIIAAFYRPSVLYVPVLCRMLSCESLGKIHENVCGLLGDIRDEAAIPALQQAVGMRSDRDRELEVPRSALAALAEIGSPEAWATVKSVAETGTPLLRRDAANLLDE